MHRVRRQIGINNRNIQGISYDGAGVGVAVLDTGVAPHPDLYGRVAVFKDFVNGRTSGYDDCGHGTHVCGILAGSGAASGGVFAGIAPGCTLVVGKVLNQGGEGNAEWMLNGLSWVLANRKQYHIKILNVSVGIGNLKEKKKEKKLCDMLEHIWNSGITVIVAAGNKGPEDGSISALGSGNNMITVGCHDGIYYRNNPQRCESYSGRGSRYGRLRKPDLVAPGTNIVSCNAFFQKNGVHVQNAYVTKSGTSMATPIVSGAAALAYQRWERMNPEEVRKKLTESATDLQEAWNKQGWGMLNVRKMLE